MQRSISERHSLKSQDSAVSRFPSLVAASFPCSRSARHWSWTRSTQSSFAAGSGEIDLACKPRACSQLITTVTRG